MLSDVADRMGTEWVVSCIDAALHAKGARLCGDPVPLTLILTHGQAIGLVTAAAVADAEVKSRVVV